MSPRPRNSLGNTRRVPKISESGSTYFVVAILPRRTISVSTPTAQTHIDSEGLARAAVGTLRRLHAIPAATIGLTEGPVAIAADLDRWHTLLERARADIDMPFEALRTALASSYPEPRPPSVVHADYHFGNLLF